MITKVKCIDDKNIVAKPILSTECFNKNGKQQHSVETKTYKASIKIAQSFGFAILPNQKNLIFPLGLLGGKNSKSSREWNAIQFAIWFYRR